MNATVIDLIIWELLIDMKKLLLPAFLSVCVISAPAFSQDKVNIDEYIKSLGPVNNMINMKHKSVCNTELTSGSSTFAMLACSRALKEDSEEQLKESEKRVESYLNGFIDTEELGQSKAQFYKLYRGTQKAWREYVKQQCALHTYELQPPGLKMETDACIAIENYLMAERLNSI